MTGVKNTLEQEAEKKKKKQERKPGDASLFSRHFGKEGAAK